MNTLCLVKNINEHTIVMKMKMLIYPEEVSSSCEFMWPDMEPLYNLNFNSVQSESTNDTSVICVTLV